MGNLKGLETFVIVGLCISAVALVSWVLLTEGNIDLDNLEGLLGNNSNKTKVKDLGTIDLGTDELIVKELCDPDTTDLQREEIVNRYKGKYITCTGAVRSIKEESVWEFNGEKRKFLIMSVWHCKKTYSTDIGIIMKADQREELLKLKEGDKVRYRAKFKGRNSIFSKPYVSGWYRAEDGEILAWSR